MMDKKPAKLVQFRHDKIKVACYVSSEVMRLMELKLRWRQATC